MNEVRENSGDEPLLRMTGIRKRFGGTLALNDVSLEVERGSIVALLGENGAGKSTLIKILAGVYAKDHGDIRFKGGKITDAKSAAHGRKCPISFIAKQKYSPACWGVALHPIWLYDHEGWRVFLHTIQIPCATNIPRSCSGVVDSSGLGLG